MKKVTTESGSLYLFDESGKVKRIGSELMRRDREWLDILVEPLLQVGHPMTLVVEPLGPDGATVRVTTPIVSVEEI